MQECIDIDAPLLDIKLIYKDFLHNIHIISDYTREEGYFDIEFRLDEQTYYSMDEFKVKAKINNINFINITDTIQVTEVDDGNPRYFGILANREIKKDM